MLRKMTVLAMAAVVAAAMALSGAASANWKHHQTPIQKDVQLGLTGQISFQGGIGKLECQITSRVVLEPGHTGLMETFVPHPIGEKTNCVGSGSLVGCQLQKLTPQTINWKFHTETDPIYITTENLTSTTTGAFCPVKHILTTPDVITATTNLFSTFSNVTLSGSQQLDFQMNNETVIKEKMTIGGKLEIEDAKQRNTYSI